MGTFNGKWMISDFAIRTRENQKRIEYISDMSIDHNRELEELYLLANNKIAIKEAASAVTDVAVKHGIMKEDAPVTADLLKQMFAMHGSFTRSVNKAYKQLEWTPEYDYFDGTQLLNSFLGLIVLPYERFSSMMYQDLDNLMKKDAVNYGYIDHLINELYVPEIPDDDRPFVFSTYNNGADLAPGRGRSQVRALWKHLRNAMAHSGNGNLFFFPLASGENAKDITHIAFFDCMFDTRSKKTVFFLAKIPLNEVREIARRLGSIACTVDQYAKSPLPANFEEIKEMIRNPSDETTKIIKKATQISRQHRSVGFRGMELSEKRFADEISESQPKVL